MKHRIRGTVSLSSGKKSSVVLDVVGHLRQVAHGLYELRAHVGRMVGTCAGGGGFAEALERGVVNPGAVLDNPRAAGIESGEAERPAAALAQFGEELGEPPRRSERFVLGLVPGLGGRRSIVKDAGQPILVHVEAMVACLVEHPLE